MVPDTLWYCKDCVVRGCPKSILMYRPGQLYGRSSVISRELQAGGKIICVCLTGHKASPWAARVHFRDSCPSTSGS
jgi:hypothetical protein